MSFISRWKQHHKNMMVWIKKDQNVIYIVAGVMAIIAIAAITSYFIPQSKKAQEQLRQYKILKKIVLIDDISHEQDRMFHDMQNSEYNMERDRMFHTADNTYHTIQYRDEKYKAAEKLFILIKDQNIFIHKLLGQTNNPFQKTAQEKFEKIEKEIDGLLQK
ncbi:MAG: hypothetical protein WC010_03395 [Candidatus Absconditabacterales bacterium]